MLKLAPSILSCDFCRLGEELDRLAQGGADYVHVDVMDGRFVPNITIGQPVIASIRKRTSLPLDVHLMIDQPVRLIADFIKAGADILTLHLESITHSRVERVLAAIRESGCKCALSIKPATPPQLLIPYLPMLDMALIMTVEPGQGNQQMITSTLDKIRFVRNAIEQLGAKCELQADGGIKLDNVHMIVEAGADVIVAGSAIFGSDDAAAKTAEFKSRLLELERG